MDFEGFIENQNMNDKTDIIKFSLQLFESKSSMIMSELEKIKDLFKLILSKCIIKFLIIS